jgi:heme exporter protein CcmB
MSMRLAVQQTAAIVGKDLRVELRTREVLYTSLLFAVVLVTVFLFSGFGETVDLARAAPGVLWVSLAFVGTLVFGRTFAREREQRAVVGLLLAPNALGPLYVGKLLVNIVMLGAVEVLLVPVVGAVFHLDLGRIAAPLFALLVAGTVGFCALGTVLAAALSTLRLREVLMPLVLFPLCLPLLLAGVKGTSVLVESGTLEAALPWLAIMLAFDALFVVLSWWLFNEALDGTGG